jgi:hypothetical protein
MVLELYYRNAGGKRDRETETETEKAREKESKRERERERERKEPVVVPHAFNPSTWEAEAGEFLSLRPAWCLQSEFQDSQGYTEKPCLEN